MHSKGQEAAPFELLVAVIVMTFVIVVGLNAMNTLLKEKCQGEIESQMEGIKTAIETVAKGQGKANAYFEMPSCYRPSNDLSCLPSTTDPDGAKLCIVQRQDETTCSFHCGGVRTQCTLLLFTSPQFNLMKCLHISPNTSFPTGSTCDPLSLGVKGEWGTAQWDTGTIQGGQYTLINEFTTASTRPIVCVYRREGS